MTPKDLDRIRRQYYNLPDYAKKRMLAKNMLACLEEIDRLSSGIDDLVEVLRNILRSRWSRNAP